MYHLIYKLNLHNLALSPIIHNYSFKLITASGSQGIIYYIFPIMSNYVTAQFDIL